VIRWARYSSRNTQLFYYQPHGGKEIDLVISRPGKKIILVEIKSTEFVEERHIEALNSSGSHFENVIKKCISNDRTAKILNGVECVHWKEFLHDLYGSV
jgi:predicted AAA+ superfamily ATPase